MQKHTLTKMGNEAVEFLLLLVGFIALIYSPVRYGLEHGLDQWPPLLHSLGAFLSLAPLCAMLLQALSWIRPKPREDVGRLRSIRPQPPKW